MIRALVVFAAGALVFAFGVWRFATVQRGIAQPTTIVATRPPHQTPSHAAHVQIQITVNRLSYVFSPANITVHAGTIVTWVNRTAAAHTITSVTPRLFDTPIGGYRTAHLTFTKPGTYSYYCALHPYMLGLIVVQR